MTFFFLFFFFFCFCASFFLMWKANNHITISTLYSILKGDGAIKMKKMKMKYDKKDQESWGLILRFSVLNRVVREPPWVSDLWRKAWRKWRSELWVHLEQKWSIHKIYPVLMVWGKKVWAEKWQDLILFSESHWFYADNISVILFLFLLRYNWHATLVSGVKCNDSTSVYAVKWSTQ